MNYFAVWYVLALVAVLFIGFDEALRHAPIVHPAARRPSHDRKRGRSALKQLLAACA
jgi:hypothetical protein